MFSVSMKTQYGIRALVRLCESVGGEISIADLSAAEDISPKYLEGIFSVLRNADLIVSVRGKNGGYRLARDPGDIKMLEIVEALEGKIRPVECTGPGNGCGRAASCASSAFWTGMKEAVDDYLSSRTLSDVAKA